jgi:murein DD-endopeptidase MepM/ murein hydrolase activator NlpD
LEGDAALARHRWTRPLLVAVLLVTALLLVVVLDVPDRLSRLWRPSAHDRYAEGLRRAGLADTALGRSWLEAGARALREAAPVTLPAQETGYLPADDPSAVGWRVEIRRGQRLEAEVLIEGAPEPQVFVDLFEARREALRPVAEARAVESGAGSMLRLEREAREDTAWALRLQPELLRSVRYTVTLRATASLSFPVEGRDARAVGSVFGDPREGGRREHHGIDIFAPAGTPALAATAGRVSRVDTTLVGGNVVWMRDEARGLSLYYAHLQSQSVRPGQRVARGEPVGRVGNTGNARSTPPHLHFGVYGLLGPADPLPYVRQPPQQPPDAVYAGVVPDIRRLSRAAPLRDTSEDRRGSGLTDATLPLHTFVAVRAAAGRSVRVVLADGRTGFVPGTALEALAVVRRVRLPGVALRDAPHARAATRAAIGEGTSAALLAQLGSWAYVEAAGTRGWVALGQSDRAGAAAMLRPSAGLRPGCGLPRLLEQGGDGRKEKAAAGVVPLRPFR